MKKTSAYTLIELLVVMAIFIFIFGSIISVMLASDRNWRVGQNIITEQQEARKAMDNIVRYLRQSSPQWGISVEANKILFYKPVFDANGTIVDTRWVIFKLNPANLQQLIRLEQGLNTVVVAQYIEDLKFTADYPVVTVEVKTKRNNTFTLISKVKLRNADTVLLAGVPLVEPPEGEF
jgi:type II secretory pathway pseudopilin PulG